MQLNTYLIDASAQDDVVVYIQDKHKLQKQHLSPSQFNDLFEDKFCAWAHGPVVPSIYHKYKGYGYDTIDTVHLENDNIFTEDAIKIIEMIWDVYGKYDGKFLEALTHAEHPWREVRNCLLKF